MKVIFYGTPALAVPTLDLLHRKAQVVAVVSQADKPAGRGLRTEPTPVKKRALELGIPVHQPTSPSKITEELRALGADLGVAVAYGRLLKPDALAVPKLGILNVHFSLLPKYRGAAPAQWALVRGEKKTGVTIFWLDEGMDTGPIFLSRELEIGPDEDASVLLERLRDLGCQALSEVLSEIEAGRVRQQPQVGTASLAPLIKKEDAKISLERSAEEVHNLVRGMRIWPRAFMDLELPSGPARVLVLKTRLGEPAEGPAGSIVRVERGGGFLVQCMGHGRLWFLTVQPEGKKPVAAADFLNGLRLGAGDFLPINR